MRNIPAASALIICLCLLSSCGDNLTFDYADTQYKSINGVHILKSYWTERFDCTHQRFRNSKLDNYDVIFHLRNNTLDDFTTENIKHAEYVWEGSEDPEKRDESDEREEQEYTFDERSSAQWIKDWLNEKAKRQFILILKDGTVSQALCDRWIQEFTTAAERSQHEAEKKRLDTRIENLKRLVKKHTVSPAMPIGESHDYDLFTLTGHQRRNHTAVSGLITSKAPTLMNSAAHISTQNTFEPLFIVDGNNFAISITIGDSRLIVLSNATAFLDASLVDQRARDMLYALSDYIDNGTQTSAPTSTTSTPIRSAWLQSSYAQREYNNPVSPNILTLLFTKKPFNYFIIHGMILIAAYIIYKSCWLGKRNSRQQAMHESFDRHIDSLAWHLKQQSSQRQQQHTRQAHYTDACASIARYHGKTVDSHTHISSEEQALLHSQEIIAPEEHS